MSADAGVQAFGVVAGSAVSVVTFATITRALGPRTFGDFAAAIAFLAIPTMLLDQGLSIAVVRQIARRPRHAARALQASLPVRAVTSLLLIGAAVGIGHLLPFPGSTRTAIAIGAVGSLATLAGGAVVPVLQYELRMVWTVVAVIGGRAITLALTLVALAAGGGLEGVAWAYVAGLAVGAALQILVVARRMSIRPVIDLPYARRLLREGAVLGSGTGAELVYWRLDSVLLALIRGSHAVGLYAAAYKFADLADGLAAGVYTSLFPSLTRFVAERDPRARALVQQALDVLVAISAPAAVIAGLFAPQVITVVAGSEYREGATALRILAAVPVVAFVGGLIQRGLLAADRERAVLLLNLGALVFNLGLNLWLIPAHGLVAAAGVTAATELVWLVGGGLAFRRALGFLPDLRSLGGVAASVGAMVVVALACPGGPAVAASASLMTYLGAVVSLPGAPRVLARDAARMLRRRAVAERVG
jgi:O-antigen/teichoic acid export membrane protein